MSVSTFNGCSHPSGLAPLSCELFGIKAIALLCIALGLAKVVTVDLTVPRKLCVGLRTWRSRFTSMSHKSTLPDRTYEGSHNKLFH